ncbi:hypothetical protein [Nostoc sp. ChiQUE01b]|uniref:hypothetical protein n=1 Tax=Nostoc sp. ChiQUE01b TaxID=3075376 RepID=UPI002AD4DA46|nr:hypothetical protein [Nostoc sp. ChiQUE01b]MDZ8261308.1 hypothetical protein [Nostoc sp. ChiQUE01b]
MAKPLVEKRLVARHRASIGQWTPEIEQAIAQIKQAFPEYSVDIEVEPNGGAYVTIAIASQYF